MSLGYPVFDDLNGKIEDEVAAKGGSFSCVDIFRVEGCETVCDLNQPARFLSEYDLVIDAGTVEHCFNVAQALINAASAVKPGGYIFHGNSLTMLNHGFYNLNPTLYQSFYSINGFQIETLGCRSNAGKGDEIPMRLHMRFAGEVNTAIYCLARRIEEKPFRYPIQAKYSRKGEGYAD